MVDALEEHELAEMRKSTLRSMQKGVLHLNKEASEEIARDHFNQQEQDEGAMPVMDTEDLDELCTITPFPDLVAQLYRKFGHTAPRISRAIIPLPGTTLKELWTYAKTLLDNWEEATVLARKNCLVALSGVINTIDSSSQQHFTQCESIRRECLMDEFCDVTPSQIQVYDRLLEVLGTRKRQSIQRLRRYCTRRSLELEEKDEEEEELTDEQERQMKEELKIVQIVELLCKEIETNEGIPKLSEQEVVCIWRGIARILFEDEIVPRMGELGAEATRSNKSLVEALFGGALSNVRNRKVDLYLQIPLDGSQKWIGICTWEAKAIGVSPDTVQTQLRKNIRINAVLANALATYVDLSFPRASPVILDIEGPQALAYLVRKVEPGVFGAGAVSEQSIALPERAADIPHFLKSGCLSALLRIADHNLAFVQMVQKNARQGHLLRMHMKAAGGATSVGKEPSIIFTPTKKRTPKEAS
ncbi:hypothetical protein BG011_001288 [Mortierella polycephala]|uniref:Uncharacterized protein n=1 Tax=Mortierella polycephala TaxID=41804 RepID=A0A9P6QA13_9FUNG|nr:hypothetical protein BG011_001288 [Mortierella polycephala]